MIFLKKIWLILIYKNCKILKTMKNNYNFFGAICFLSILLSICASYNIAIMDHDGTLIQEHTTKVYVGTDMFVPDAVIGTLGAAASMFYVS